MKLFDYQTRAVNYMLSRKRGALFLDCGLGKTLITLTWLYLKRKDIKRVLIIAPLRVAQHTWTAEIDKWKIPFSVSQVLGSEKKRIEALDKKAFIYIINTDNLVWLTQCHEWDFDCLIIDELSNFKSYNSYRFRVLKKVKYEYFWGLTGTPTPNNLMQVWPQMYLIDRGQRLEKSITAFRHKYCNTVPMAWGNDYELKPESVPAIHGKVKDCCLSMKAVNPPPVVVNDIEVAMDTIEVKRYEKFKKEYVFWDNDDEVIAQTAAVLAGKLRQLANGFIYNEDKRILRFHNKKLDALEDIIEDSNGANILLFINFKADRDAVMKRFPEARDLNIDAWNAGNIPLMMAHPASAGHGLNLQDGGHIIVWFGVPWDYELYHQANARLARTGQKETVIIHRIMTKNTIDYKIVSALKNKCFNMAALIEAVKDNKD